MICRFARLYISFWCLRPINCYNARSYTHLSIMLIEIHVHIIIIEIVTILLYQPYIIFDQTIVRANALYIFIYIYIVL